MATPIGTLGTIPTLTVGGVVFTDMTNLITVLGNAASTYYTTLRKPTASSGYQVPGGQTFSIYALRAVGQSLGGNYSLGYADDDVGILGTAPTNPVYVGGDAQNYVVPAQSTLEILEVALPTFNVPAAKYTFIKGITAGQYVIYAFGYSA